MLNPESLIRSILGPIKKRIRPLACAVEVTAELLFVQHIPMDDVSITSQVYAKVGEQLHKSSDTVSRSIYRLVDCCWTCKDQARLAEVIGKSPALCQQTPWNMLVYLACYAYLEKPFFEVIDKMPQLLF